MEEILRHYLRAIKFVMKRFYVASIIRNYDRKSDYLIDKTTDLAKNGFITFDLDKFFKNKYFASRLTKDKLCNYKTKNGVAISWDLPTFFWEILLSNQNLVKLVKSYLGPFARLDDAYLKTISDGVKSVSEGWHDDNVGYRLKLFIVFNVEGEAAPTIFLPKARPNLYKFSLLSEINRIIFKKLEKKEIKNSKKIHYSKGTCLLFDTNILHRGGFSETSGVRHCIIVEFIDSRKGDKISKFSPCGPMQGKGVIKIKTNNSIVDNCDLIDKSILSKNNEGFLYGKA